MNCAIVISNRQKRVSSGESSKSYAITYVYCKICRMRTFTSRREPDQINYNVKALGYDYTVLQEINERVTKDYKL